MNVKEMNYRSLKISILLVVSTLLITISSCEKLELPEPDQKTPVFGLSFQLGETTINLGGLSTRLESDVYWDELGVRVFENVFINDEAEATLTFRLRDNRPTILNLAHDTSFLFQAGRYEFLNNTNRNQAARYLINRSQNPDLHPFIEWMDANSIDTTKGRPFHLVPGFNPQSEYTVCQTIKNDTEACSTTYCKWWKYSDGEIPLLGFGVKANGIWPIIAEGYSKPLTYIWNGEEADALHVVKQSGIHEVRIFTGLTIAEVEMYISLDDNGEVISPCFDNFSSELVNYSIDPAFSQVEVIWKDKDGKEYFSSSKAQPTNSFFTIEEVTPFNIRNPDGHKVQKINVNFDCTLFSQSGETILLKGAQGVFGLPYF